MRGTPNIGTTRFYVGLVVGTDKDTRQVLRVVAHDHLLSGFTPCCEHRVPVADVKERETFTLDGPRLHRQELHHEAQGLCLIGEKLAGRRHVAERLPDTRRCCVLQATMGTLVIALCNFEHHPAFVLGQCEGRALLRLPFLAALGRTTGGPGQPAQAFHQCAVEPFDGSGQIRGRLL